MHRDIRRNYLGKTTTKIVRERELTFIIALISYGCAWFFFFLNIIWLCMLTNHFFCWELERKNIVHFVERGVIRLEYPQG